MNQICIYNPSWHSFGGGEKYACTLADTLAGEKSTSVTILADTPDVTGDRLRQYFNLNLVGVNVEQVARHDVTSRLASSDVAIVLSNVRPFGNWAHKSVYILQIPYPPFTLWRTLDQIGHGQIREIAKDVLRSSLLRDVRKSDLVLVYSDFVKDILARAHGIQSVVLYPSIDDFASSVRKQNVLLSVGRFFRGLYNDKRYDILIEAFKQLYRSIPGCSWQYRLVGSCGTDRASQRYVEFLRSSARGYPVSFHINAPYADLRQHYGEASLFWHAAGYGVDEGKHPERTEHFGMSTVEAMSARCVPLVIDKGGQKEIVLHGESGYLWKTVDELVLRTRELMQDKTLLRDTQRRARSRFQDFNRKRFSQRCLSLFQQMELIDHGKT